MHNTDKQYIRCIIYHNKTSTMHNLRTNFDKFFDLTKSIFKNRINDSGNLRFYSNKPKMTDCEIIALSLTSESLGIDSENYLWRKHKCDFSDDFPALIDVGRSEFYLSSLMFSYNVSPYSINGISNSLIWLDLKMFKYFLIFNSLIIFFLRS